MIEIFDIIFNVVAIFLSYFTTVILCLVRRTIIKDYKHENLTGKLLAIGFFTSSAVYLFGLDIFLPIRLIDKIEMLS